MFAPSRAAEAGRAGAACGASCTIQTAARPALEDLDEEDLDDLAAAPVFEVARSLQDQSSAAFPTALLERLNDRLAQQLTGPIAAEPAPPAPAVDCVRALKLLRYNRERAALQREIDGLRDDGSATTAERIEQLYDRKVDLKRRIEQLAPGKRCVDSWP